MYLSRIKLNKHSKRISHFLSSPQVAHATVEGAFSDEDNTRKLWRIDYYKDFYCVLLMSQNKPNLHSFIEQFGYPEEEPEIKDYTPFLNHLKTGQKYRFRLVANPVQSVSEDAGQRGKIRSLVTIAQQEEWLSKRSEKLGCNFLQFELVTREKKIFKRKTGKVILSTATYEGVLEITNIELFKTTLINGVGRAKSYGCGLLTLAKL